MEWGAYLDVVPYLVGYGEGDYAGVTHRAAWVDDVLWEIPGELEIVEEDLRRPGGMRMIMVGKRAITAYDLVENVACARTTGWAWSDDPQHPNRVAARAAKRWFYDSIDHARWRAALLAMLSLGAVR
jgi:hypothetical protein